MYPASIVRLVYEQEMEMKKQRKPNPPREKKPEKPARTTRPLQKRRHTFFAWLQAKTDR